MAVGKSRRLSEKLLATIRWAGLLTAISLAIHTIFIYSSGFDSLSRSPLIIDFILLPTLALFYVLLGFIEFYVKPKSDHVRLLILIIYYLALASFNLLVCNEPMISNVLWLLLLIMTGILLGYKALAIGSIFAFTIISTSSILLSNINDSGSITTIIIGELLAISTAYYITYLRTAGVVQFDVYEQLKFKEKVQRQRLETVINSINDTVLNIGSTGKIKLYNAATLALLDTNQNINGKEFDEVFNLSNENHDKISIIDIIKNTQQIVERNDLTHTYSDGQKINLFLSLSKVRSTFDAKNSSNIGGFILIIRDITKQKSLDEERDEFIAVVSHELRTPVAITEGTLSNLEFALSKNNDSKYDIMGAIEQAHKQVLFLSQMVNDLSTLSRAQRGVNMEPEKVNVKDFMHELYSKYLSEAQARHLSLDIDSNANTNVKVARMAIEEIMQNLITNAFKYTKVGGVTVGTKIVKDGGSVTYVEFFVKDTGIGISKTDQTHVFQRFWRSEDYRTRETSGTGLGLHVVEKLASTINTAVELKSRLNHGSTFSFKLPVDHEN